LNKKLEKIAVFVIKLFVFILILCLTVSLNWIIFCGLVKVVAIILGISFSWSVATCIWLAFLLISVICGEGGMGWE